MDMTITRPARRAIAVARSGTTMAVTRDARGYRVTGATGNASCAYEAALAAFQSWRSGAEPHLAQALREAPGFVMAHVLQACLLVCSREPGRVRAAAPVAAYAGLLPANERESMHLGVLGAVLADDYELAKVRLDQLLLRYPRDVLALQVGHAFDYLTGDVARLSTRVARVVPHWSAALPGYHAVLAMRAFSLEECGQYQLAEECAHAALAIEPADARAHHVMAHLFEMTARPAAGIAWMRAHRAAWSANTVVATHCWWHLALFLLAREQPAAALSVYDRQIRVGAGAAVADLIDASALLWRAMLLGADAGARWQDLADAWEPHIEDRFCSFSDLHAMLAFSGARDERRIARLERALETSAAQHTRHGATTALFGLAACRAIAAFGRGEHARALAMLAALPPLAHRFGGSHAQRDVLYLTLEHALRRTRSAAVERAA